jgi:nitrogen regulatory protein P-II 1
VKIGFCVEVAVEKSLPLPQKSAKQGEKSSAPAKAVAFFFEKQGGKSSARQWARIFLRKTRRKILCSCKGSRILLRKTRRIGMKKLEIIIKPEKLEDLKALLDSEEVNGLNIVNSMGYGNQKGIIKNYRGAEYAVNLLPKIKVETVVADEVAPKLIDKIVEQINTGHIGDGKIFMYEVEDAIRIRTGERGVDAL